MSKFQTAIGGLGLTIIIASSTLAPENKVYVPGTYYTGNTEEKIDYRALYSFETNYNNYKDNYIFSDKIPSFSQMPDAVDEKRISLLKIFDTDTYSKIKDINSQDYLEKSEYQFTIKGPAYFYTPFDGKIIDIYPKIKKGIIQNFESYFKGMGVYIKLEMENDNYTYRMTISNLKKTWQSFQSEIGCKEISSNRIIYYTNFDKEVKFKKGTPIAITGNTGGIPVTSQSENDLTYLTVKLEILEDRQWKDCPLKVLYK